MGEEFQMARQEEGRWPMLLAITRSGETIYDTFRGDKRQEEANTTSGEEAEEAIPAAKEGKNSTEVKGDNTITSRPKRRRRNNKVGKPAREPEDGDGGVRRSAQELGVIWPGSSCSDSPTGAHWLAYNDQVDGGHLFRCKYCHIYKWFPGNEDGQIQMGYRMERYGPTEGYCRTLNLYPRAMVLVAKLQDLHRLRATIADDEAFVKLVQVVMEDKSYGHF
jgi:hypothetical protein